MCEQFVVGSIHAFSIGLRDTSNEWIAKANPTIEAADFLIDINDTGWVALDNTPVVKPTGSEFVDVTFSIAETTAAGVGGDIKFRAADADAASGWIGGVLRFVGVVAAPATTADVATITSALTTIDDFLDTEIAAILAKVNALPVDPADASDIAASFTTLTNKLTKYVQLLARKDAAIATNNATELTAINANGGSGAGAFANTTDSAEAMRDRGDAAWITATGFATPANITTAQTAITNAIAALNNLTAAQVWAYATRSLTGTAAAQTNPVVGSTLNITRAATYGPHSLTGLTVPDGWTSARWTVKRGRDKASADPSTALIQILVSATPNAATDGLVVLNGSDDGLTLTDASLSISGTTATISIADHVTAVLDRGAYEYDIKFYRGSSASTVVTTATCNVVVTPTQTV